MLIPALAIILLISIYPMGYAFFVSLHKTSYLKITEYVGIKNLWQVLVDPEVQHSIFLSIQYILGTLCITIPLGFVLAIIFTLPLKFNAIFRTILVVPWLISQVATATFWMYFLHPEFGPVNYFLKEILGTGRVLFLETSQLAMPTLIVINSWMLFPFAMVLLSAAMQGIPRELHEAARLDGAKGWEIFWDITLPLCLNTLLMTIIMILLHTFNMVTLIYILTGGGPLNATHTLSYKIFYDAFSTVRISHASVLGVIMFVMNMMISVAYIKILKREAAY